MTVMENTPNGPHPLTHVVHVDPAQARRTILEAFRKERTHLANTAARLRCGYATLMRWIRTLKIEKQIRRLMAVAKTEGWDHGRGRMGGRPEGSLDRQKRAPYPKKKKRAKQRKAA